MSFVPHFLDFVHFANHIFTVLLPPSDLPLTSLVVDHMYAQITLFGYATDLVELQEKMYEQKELGNKLRGKIARMFGNSKTDTGKIWNEEPTKEREGVRLNMNKHGVKRGVA